MIREFYSSHRRSVSIGVSTFAVVLTAVYVVAPNLAGIAALVGTWAVPLGLAAVANWERVETIGGRLLTLTGGVSTRAERVGISAEMQGQINGARNALEGELEGVLPHAVRVKFVRSPEELSTLCDGEIVVALGNHRKRAENLARAALAYTSADLIRPARPYIDPTVMTSVDYSVTKRILWASSRDALDYFLRSIWPEALRTTPTMQNLAHEIETIERHGLLTRVMLAEFLDLGRRLYPDFAPLGVHETTVDFVHYLYRIVTKTRDENLGQGLVFQRGQIRVGIVLVADGSLAARQGARPYVWRCMQDIKIGCTAIYLLARGSNGVLVPAVLAGLQGNGRVLDIGEPHRYELATNTGSVTVTCARILCDQRGYRDASSPPRLKVVAS